MERGLTIEFDKELHYLLKNISFLSGYTIKGFVFKIIKDYLIKHKEELIKEYNFDYFINTLNSFLERGENGKRKNNWIG